MSRYKGLLDRLLIVIFFVVTLGAQAQQTCITIPGVTADWDSGVAPPPLWQGADPDLLTDGLTADDWYYYWSPGTQIPVIFNLPAGYQITGIRWHDHFGDGDVTMVANTGQIKTFNTSHWPLSWHQEDWVVSGATSVSMTKSDNPTKVSEITFCGTQTSVDTTPPDSVQLNSPIVACDSINLSWAASTDYDDGGSVSGTAEKYRISINAGAAIEVTSLNYVIPATENTTYTVSITAVDAQGNESTSVTQTYTTPFCPPAGSCNTIQGVTAQWQAGNPVPPGWQGGDPSILVDGLTNDAWYYYWTTTSDRVPIVFNLPPGSNIEAVRWHDHHGAGDVELTTNNGQITSFSTDEWPLDWHTHNWSVSNVTSVSMVTENNQAKIAELTFCSGQGSGDTVPPDPVDDLVGVATSCTTADFTWSAPADYDSNGPSGAASSYAIWAGSNSPTSTFQTQATLSNLVADSTNVITITAFDAAGNESSSYSITLVTPPCTAGGLDKDLSTVNIIDSFGHETVPNTNGHQWSAISSYYDTYYDSGGDFEWVDEDMCSEDIHNRYWVLADENGQPMGSADYDGDGDFESYYPSWHPPVHNPGQSDECYFMHDHGEDPRLSPLYDLDDPVSVGVPFGYVHSKLGNMNDRLEDHVGHKVIVENDFALVYGNPYGPGSVFDEAGISCNWLSKIHQGSHSTDALGNNLHEYFLNIDCDDNPKTHVRVKELVTWGYPNHVYNEGSSNCSADVEWFWPGYDASEPFHSPDSTNSNDEDLIPPGAIRGPFSDGKREFGCAADRDDSDYDHGYLSGTSKLLGELWKPDGEIKAPDSTGTVIYSPYYVTLNPPRYVDPNWEDRFDNDVHNTYLGFSCDGVNETPQTSDDCLNNSHCMDVDSNRHDGCSGTGAMVSSVDMCVRGSDAWEYSVLAFEPSYNTPGEYPGFCYILDTTLRTTWENEIGIQGDSLALSNARKHHVNNPFDGTMRGVHPKQIQIYASPSSATNYMGFKLFCTDAFGDNSQFADLSDPNAPECPDNTIMQVFSADSNNWSGISGSSVNAVTEDGDPQDDSDDNEVDLVGGGEGSEFIIDGITDPNNKVRSPN